MTLVLKSIKVVVRSTIFLSAASGILATFAFAPFNWPVVGWLAPWPVFILAERYKKSVWKMIGAGLLISFFICTFAFYWTVHLFVVFGGLPVWASLFVFVAHTFALNLKIPLFLVLLGLLRRNKLRRFRLLPLFTIPLLAMLFDRYTPQIFNWYWGNLIAGNLYLVQIADIAGIHGITFLYFTVTYAVYRSLPVVAILVRKFQKVRRFEAKDCLRRRITSRFATPVFILVVWFSYGVVQKVRYESLQSTLPQATIAAIQPNAPLEKYGEKLVTKEVINTLIQATIPELVEQAVRSVGQPLDLIVLPESAVPYYTTQDSLITRRIGAFDSNFAGMIVQLSSGYETPVFFNEIQFEVHADRYTGQPRLDAYNSASVFNRSGERDGVYHKRILIPFGEQIPYADFLDQSGLIQLVPESVRYSRFRTGSEFTLLPYRAVAGTAEEARFLPLICYEILDPGYVRDFVNSAKSDFIVNITQDRWYGKTIETYQHYELGRIRAVENRKAIVRSTNSGTSGMVDLAGNYAKPIVGPVFTGQEVEAVQVFSVPVQNQIVTLYSKTGNNWMWALLAAWAGSIAFRAFNRRPPIHRRNER